MILPGSVDSNRSATADRRRHPAHRVSPSHIPRNRVRRPSRRYLCRATRSGQRTSGRSDSTQASATRCARRSRSRRLAATPPAIRIECARCSRAARIVFSLRTSTIASSNEAARSATGRSSRKRGGRCSGNRPPALRNWRVVPDPVPIDLAQGGRLQPGEAEIERAAQVRTRKRIAIRVAASRRLLDRRSARIAQPQQSRALVERLAGCIVDRLAEHRELADLFDQQQFGVPARHQQANRWQPRRVEILARQLQPIGVDMRFQVIDRNERLAQRHRQRLGGVDAHDQRTGQAGTLGEGNRVDRR